MDTHSNDNKNYQHNVVIDMYIPKRGSVKLLSNLTNENLLLNNLCLLSHTTLFYFFFFLTSKSHSYTNTYVHSLGIKYIYLIPTLKNMSSQYSNGSSSIHVHELSLYISKKLIPFQRVHINTPSHLYITNTLISNTSLL